MSSKVSQAQLRDYQKTANTFFEMSRELSMRAVVFGVEEGPLRLDHQNAARAGDWHEQMLLPTQSKLSDSLEALGAVGPETGTLAYFKILFRLKSAALEEFHAHYGEATRVQASSIVEAAKFRIKLEASMISLMAQQCLPWLRSGPRAVERVSRLLECL